MNLQVKKFVEGVRKELDADEPDTSLVEQAIETSYERHIAEQMSKADFLVHLIGDPAVFAITVNHLFIPVNWSEKKMRQLWGIKNTATGNLVALGSDGESENGFILRDGGQMLDFSPMTSGNEEHIRQFLSLLKEPIASDAPIGVGEALIELEMEKGVNPANLTVVRVDVIF